MGGTMLEHAILGLRNLTSANVDRIVVITLSSHFIDIDIDAITSRLTSRTGIPVEFYFLEEPTRSVVDTISAYLHGQSTDQELLIKDSDNFVDIDLAELSQFDNAMAYASLKEFPSVVAHNKSFLEMGLGETIFNIVEKQIISDRISVGLTKFATSSDFLHASMSLGAVSNETYISDLVRALLSQGVNFNSIKARGYEDWGTLEDWLGYIGKFQTLFIDVDGVVSENMSPIKANSNWSDFTPIDKNIDALLEMQNQGKTQLIFVTARGEDFRSKLEASLREQGFSSFQLIMGLMHAKRILVNDFAVTNPYPSAQAVNIPRNSGDLRSYLN